MFLKPREYWDGDVIGRYKLAYILEVQYSLPLLVIVDFRLVFISIISKILINFEEIK